MRKIEKILAACDLSEYSPSILRCAARLTVGMKAELIIANIISRRDVETLKQILIQNTHVGKDWNASDYLRERKTERIGKIQKLIRGLECTCLAPKIILR